MIFERGDFVILGEMRLPLSDLFMVERYLKFFYLVWQKNSNADITEHITFFFKLNFFIFKLLFKQSFWQGYGFLLPWGRFLVEMRVHSQRLSKFCQSHPLHNQRTHSNSRTQQIVDPVMFKCVISSFHIKRRSMKTRASYAKKKLTPMKKKVVKVVTKKKGPVVRTRDKVKSV